MFDIGSGELVVIGVVALVAIGPKELPGVLRMVGQWVGKARRMASEFQSQFNEAMREAEMADLKKSFDDVAETVKDVSGGNLLGTATKHIESAFGEPETTGTATGEAEAAGTKTAEAGETVNAPASLPAEPAPVALVPVERTDGTSTPPHTSPSDAARHPAEGGAGS
jgi:sec-independent protein translocase protein TatB